MNSRTAQVATSRGRLRADDIFFPGMAILILGIIVIGFGQSYFLAGMITAPLPDVLVHIHGALFVSWALLLLFQSLLAASGRLKIHMTLGLSAFVLAPVMVVVAAFTLCDSIRRNDTPIPGELLLVGDFMQIAVFASLTAWGILARRNAASHKRLMILGTMAMLGPAIDRFPLQHTVLFTLGLQLSLPLLIMVYDLATRRRVHHSTAIGFATMVGATVLIFPLTGLAVVHDLVRWILRA